MLLHFRYCVYRSTGAFYAFIREWPESLEIADANGRLPLHVALENVYKRNSVEAGNVVVEELLYKNRHAVEVADSRGRLPLRVALDPANGVPFHIVRRYLLGRTPTLAVLLYLLAILYSVVRVA